jgi:putative SOS response-associated peptidase YedK
MCGRYVVTNAVHKTREIVKSAIAVSDTDNFNASPQQKLPLIKSYTNGKTIESLQWGLTHSWDKEKKIKPLINARLETLEKKISFKNLINNNRCLVVADGYYEWKREKIGKQPYYFTRFDNNVMYFAGIYKYHQFTIITMQVYFNAIDIHHRQPVIIDEKDLNNYFNLKKEGTSFLKSYKAPNLKFHPVSKDVNNPINNTKELIDELK